ncbi:MAG: hypothetical protein PUF30_10690 [bacterium]|nr:hypothetical protein [bacterium]
MKPFPYQLPPVELLPPVCRQVVANAPQSRKIPSFIALLGPLCALATRVRIHYYHDPMRLHALLVQVIVEGEQSSGKSFAADIERLIMDGTLKARDKLQRRIEQEYRERKRRRKANERMEEEPHTSIRVIPPTISKTMLTKRADNHDRFLGDTLTFWMFAEELAQVTDAGKAGYSNLRTIMRTAYDLGSLFGMDFASDNSHSAITDINICSMFCATPSAVDKYYDRESIEGGNITRCILCPIDNQVENDDELFQPFTELQRHMIDQTLQKMMDDTYNPDGSLAPTLELDMSWIDDACREFIHRKGREYAKCNRESVKVFRIRASVSAFRATALCYYLYQLDPERDWTEEERREQCLQIYRFLSEYIMQGLLDRWGDVYDELHAKRVTPSGAGKGSKPKLYDCCTEKFTRDQLSLLIEQQQMKTDVRHFISLWKNLGLIEEVSKNVYRKLEP